MTLPPLRAAQGGSSATPSSSDAELMEAVRRADQEAFSQLYLRHAPLVYAAACRAAGRARAEAVTHEVFMQIWRSPECFQPGRESVRGFLVGLATAAAADPHRPAAHDGSESPQDPSLSLLSLLPAAAASVLAVVVWGGCTYREAAVLLGEEESVVRREAVHGVQALRVALRSA